MSNPLVIYHANCPDGFTSAWVAARALGDVDLFEGRYGEAPPTDQARGRDVYIVDFSYPRAQVTELASAARFLTVLDHHKTAEADLLGLEPELAHMDIPIRVVFDMRRSGAGITWDFFHPGEPRPWIVDYVEDRDLWRFELAYSEMISLYIRAAPHKLESWDEMSRRELETIRLEARGCQRYLDHYVRDALRNAYDVAIEYAVPSHVGAPADIDWLTEPAVAVNVSYTGVSDVLHEALQKSGKRLAIGWHVAADGRLNCSFRSTPDLDCSAIARHFGGGGHAQASGFRLRPSDSLGLRLTRLVE